MEQINPNWQRSVIRCTECGFNYKPKSERLPRQCSNCGALKDRLSIENTIGLREL